jgi:hypothetical protein
MATESNENLCVICQTEIDKTKHDDNIFIECLHCFHRECWEMYRLHNTQNQNGLTCPICKTVLDGHVTINIQPVLVAPRRAQPQSNVTTDIQGSTTTRDVRCCCLDRKTTMKLLIILSVIIIIIIISMIVQGQNH